MLAVLVLLPGPATATATAGDGPGGPASGIVAAGSGGLQLDAVVNEVSVTGRRIVLDPEQPTRVLVTVRNNRNEPAQIRSIRVSGSALGLTFFVFDTAVRMDVPPGASLAWSVDIDMAELRGQATGLLPMSVTLRDAKRDVLASADGIADIRGTLVCTYGMFGLGLLVVTAMLWAAALFALARHRLPHNRWRRAVRFAPAGCGAGFVAIVSLSALRVTAPSTSSNLTFIAAAAGIGFLLGYLTPTPVSAPASLSAPAPAPAPVPAGTPATGPSAVTMAAARKTPSTDDVPVGDPPGGGERRAPSPAGAGLPAGGARPTAPSRPAVVRPQPPAAEAEERGYERPSPRPVVRPQQSAADANRHGYEKPRQPPARFFDEETDPSITRRTDWRPRQDDPS
ncbi:MULTISPECIES: hypothetical protein [Protofrankia]|uniref:hypothetical protein n=1 Tax=Protofrankia TaxID=2994361 RepID=UPI0011155A8B|nr:MULTISPECIES: hypothetical protein [Protofrankia]